MRPRGIPSRRIKILPWYYTEKDQPTRAAELRDALREESRAEAERSLPGRARWLLAQYRALHLRDPD